MWLSGCAVVLPDQVLPRGAVRIEDGFIAAIRDRPVDAADIDASELTLIPGLIDLHGDMIEREIQPRPGALFPIEMAVAELDARHAAGGVTTAFAAVSFAENARAAIAIRSEAFAQDIIHTIAALQERLSTDLHVHARFEVNNDHAVPILRELIADRIVDLVSLTDHTPGQGQYRDIERYVRYRARKDGISEAKSAEQAKARIAAQQANPSLWENARDVAALARDKGLTLASHDDDTPEKVALMYDLGARISEFPVSIEAAREARRRGLTTVMGAPNALRGVSNSGNLLARDALGVDVLDALASDYHAGAMLHAAFALEREAPLPLPKTIRLVSTAPAEAVGLADRGAVEVGKRADLVLVQPAPLLRVRMTLKNGSVIYSGGGALGPSSQPCSAAVAARM